MAEKIAAIVYYLTADVNEGGELRFYKDMYDMEK
jgi:murein L,D-transpeptidase YcbB/YkuD